MNAFERRMFLKAALISGAGMGAEAVYLDTGYRRLPAR